MRQSFRGRGKELTGEKGGDRERDADAQNGDGNLRQRRARSAHDRVFRIADQLSDRKKGPDQRSRWHELVDVARQAQAYIKQASAERVAFLADVPELVNQIEQCKEH